MSRPNTPPITVPSTMPTHTDIGVSSTVPSQTSSAWRRQSCVSVEEVTPIGLTMMSQVSPIAYSVQMLVGSGER